jgi:molybdate transport system substrate-binding protein
MKKRVLSVLLAGCLVLGGLVGCTGSNKTETEESKKETAAESAKDETKKETGTEKETKEAASDISGSVMVAAAASLEYSFVEELIPMFQKKYPNITVEGTYDSSGKLQTQIEEGMPADVFVSAAMKQMNALTESDLVEKGSVVELLENKIVLIVPEGSASEIKSFEDINKVGTIALGDPESVPVGQYAQEALTSLGLWDEIQSKVSFGTNVTEVLNWVAEGSAEVGIVYATDAATTDKVKVIAEAPEGSLEKKVIYPMGIVKASENKEAAKLFEDFLESDEALAVFEEYGFTPNK